MRKCRVFLFLVLALLLTASKLEAQTQTDGRVWLSVPVQGHIGSDKSPWRWSFELIMRSRDGLEELDTLTIRPSIFYNLSRKVIFGGGYANVTVFPVTGEALTENRIYGQFQYTQPTAIGSLSLRTRVEDRNIESNDGHIGRIREQVRLSRPFHKGSRLSLVGFDEILVHTNDTSRLAKGIEQNRAFGGISYAILPTTRFEIGYLNQYYPGHRGANDRMNHVLSTTFGMNF